VIEGGPTRKRIWIEDVHALCLRALQTETQVMVKREDEAGVRRAQRRVSQIRGGRRTAALPRISMPTKRIRDFQIACSHLESLHSHGRRKRDLQRREGRVPSADFMDFRFARVLSTELPPRNTRITRKVFL